MQWLASTEREDDLNQPFEIIREVPTQLTKRLKTLRDVAADNEQATLGTADLKPFRRV